MKNSRYFSELSFSYDAEINDLLTDSEGNSVFKTRLMEKRKEIKSILPMIEFSPEMVLPVFYDGFPSLTRRPWLPPPCANRTMKIFRVGMICLQSLRLKPGSPPGGCGAGRKCR